MCAIRQNVGEQHKNKNGMFWQQSVRGISKDD